MGSGRLLVAHHIEQQGNLYFAADGLGQQWRLQVFIAEQFTDRLEVIQQVRGLLQRIGSVHRVLRVAVNGDLAEDSPVRDRNGNSRGPPDE